MVFLQGLDVFIMSEAIRLWVFVFGITKKEVLPDQTTHHSATLLASSKDSSRGPEQRMIEVWTRS